MSESANTIIKYFCDRFLDLDYYPSSLKVILDLELKKIKNIKKEDLQKFYFSLPIINRLETKL